MRPDPPLLEVRALVLTFDGRPVLNGVDLTLRPGEIHAVVGEHGAGKTSLASVLSGTVGPSGGEIRVLGQSLSPWNRDRALSLGIEIVAQATPSFDQLTIAENLVMDGRSGIFPFLNQKDQLAKGRRFLEECGVSLDPRRLMGDLHLSDKVLVDILRNLYRKPRVLILDEAFDKLSTENLSRVRGLLQGLRDRGASVLHITHRIDDVFDLADRVTVLRGGRVIFTDTLQHIDRFSLIRMAYTQMTGMEAAPAFSRLIRFNEAILADLPVNLLVLDTGLKPVLVNREARKVLAETAGSPDLPFGDLMGPANSAVAARIEEACRSGVTRSFYKVPLETGRGVSLNDITISPVLDGGQTIGSMIILNDVTEQERFRERASLAENLSSLGLLAAGVAHEINNPLDIIGYYLENIRFQTKDDGLLKAVQSIEEELEAIAKIVGNLIAFSDKKPREQELFDLGQLTSELLELIRFSAEANGVEMVLVRAPGAPLGVRGDRSEIRQAILNIIKNALEAMPGGGSLTVRCSRGQRHGQDFAALEFTDTGPGIDAALAPEIFLPFRSDKSGKNNSGLGLSISHGIVTKHGGSLRAESLTAPAGARFTLELPEAVGSEL